MRGNQERALVEEEGEEEEDDETLEMRRMKTRKKRNKFKELGGCTMEEEGLWEATCEGSIPTKPVVSLVDIYS